MAFNPVEFAKRHPVETGLAVVGLGLVLFMLMRGGGNSQAASSAQLAASYYGAQSADTQAGDAVQIATINAQAATTQALAADAAQQNIQGTWAQTGLQETQSNNATATTLAPYAIQSQAVAALGQATTLPNITTTTASKGWGFGPFHGGGGTTTTVAANPAAVEATSELAGLINGFHAGA